jgi:hypothetical protein
VTKSAVVGQNNVTTSSGSLAVSFYEDGVINLNKLVSVGTEDVPLMVTKSLQLNNTENLSFVKAYYGMVNGTNKFKDFKLWIQLPTGVGNYLISLLPKDAVNDEERAVLGGKDLLKIGHTAQLNGNEIRFTGIDKIYFASVPPSLS